MAGTMTDRMAELRSAVEGGADLLEAAAATATRNDEDAAFNPDAPAAGVAAPPSRPPAPAEEAEEAEEAEGLLESAVDDEALQQLAEQFEDGNPYRTHEGDPEGSYRDEANRLRDVATHKFLSEKDAGVPATGQGEAGEAPYAEPADPDAALVVELPPRRDGEEPYRFVARSEEEANALRRGVNGGLRAAELERQLADLDQERASLEQIEQIVRTHPSDFVMAVLGDADRTTLTRELVAALPPEAFDQLVSEVADWRSNPVARENVSLRADGDRRDRQTERERQGTQKRRITTEAAKIGRAILELIPQGTDDRSGERAFRLMSAEIRSYMKANNLRTIRPENVERVLDESGVLTQLGLKPAKAAGGPTSDPKPPTPPTRRPAKSGPAGGPAVQEARKVGDSLAERAKKRRQASAVAPTGSGTAPATETMKALPGETVREQIPRLRKMLGLDR